jgi:hypothetical protein
VVWLDEWCGWTSGVAGRVVWLRREWLKDWDLDKEERLEQYSSLQNRLRVASLKNDVSTDHLSHFWLMSERAVSVCCMKSDNQSGRLRIWGIDRGDEVNVETILS